MWVLFESVHAVTYFAPEARAAFEAAGLRGYWRGYFAGRAAPLGAVNAAPVIALFSSFAPHMVGRAIPDVWTRATPEAAIAARAEGAAAALRALGAADGVEEAADLAERAAGLAPTSGRALGAANAGLPRLADPVARLWQATTTLREHRGDGHVAALVGAGLAGTPALVLKAALEGYPAIYGPARGWSDEEWARTGEALAARGYLADDGTPTEAGRAAYQAVEDVTDRLAGEVWRALGEAETRRLAELLRPVARAASSAMPFPNPIGVPRPADVG
ncbi:MAG TPA: hypothetical protein VHI50_00220 [Micromonosporaceae bacterium]|jgi:hypothetical protein|nr:hypothetical protein [Micromonosporaceae bacterium]